MLKKWQNGCLFVFYDRKKVLITGFEEFGPYSSNVAKELVTQFDQRIIEISGNLRLRIMGIVLPINFSTFRKILAQTVHEIKPNLVIGLGMDFKDSDRLSFELLAHSTPSYGSAIADKEGNFGTNEPLDGFSEIVRLPNEERLRFLIAKIDGMELSENAGRHMCETVFRDLIIASDGGNNFQPAFVHLPHTPDLLEASAYLDRHKHSMPLEKQKAILLALIKRIANG